MIRSPFPLLSMRPKKMNRVSQVRSRVVQAEAEKARFCISCKNRPLQNFVPGGPGGPGGFHPITHVRARVGVCFFVLIFSFVKKNLDHLDQIYSDRGFRLDQTLDRTWTTWDR